MDRARVVSGPFVVLLASPGGLYSYKGILCGVRFLAALLGLLGLLRWLCTFQTEYSDYYKLLGVLCCVWLCLLCFDAGDVSRRFLGAFMAFCAADTCAGDTAFIRLSTAFNSVLAYF